jgi:hypothetical protein
MATKIRIIPIISHIGRKFAAVDITGGWVITRDVVGTCVQIIVCTGPTGAPGVKFPGATAIDGIESPAKLNSSKSNWIDRVFIAFLLRMNRVYFYLLVHEYGQKYIILKKYGLNRGIFFLMMRNTITISGH